MNPRALDLAGQRFGMLTIQSRAANSPHGKTHWLCVCDCGSSTVVRGTSLKTGNTTSCGCIQAASIRHTRKAVVGIRAAHCRVVAARGKASNLACADCRGPAVDWSYTYTDPHALIAEDGAPYSLDVSHYVPRCRPCHKRHDLIFDASLASICKSN